MASLSPIAIAIAVQGLGFGPASAALHGLMVLIDEAIQELDRQALTAAAAEPRRMRIKPNILPYPQTKNQPRTRAAREKEYPVLCA